MSAFVYLQLFSKKKKKKKLENLFSQKSLKQNHEKIFKLESMFCEQGNMSTRKMKQFTDVFWVRTEEKVLSTQNPHCHFIGMVTQLLSLISITLVSASFVDNPLLCLCNLHIQILSKCSRTEIMSPFKTTCKHKSSECIQMQTACQ